KAACPVFPQVVFESSRCRVGAHFSPILLLPGDGDLRDHHLAGARRVFEVEAGSQDAMTVCDALPGGTEVLDIQRFMELTHQLLNEDSRARVGDAVPKHPLLHRRERIDLSFESSWRQAVVLTADLSLSQRVT